MITVNITAELKTKLDILCSEYSYEIGGYLTGETRNGELFLTDILIPSQVVSSAHVEIRPQDQIDLLKRYKDKCKKIIGHFHSHHSMGAFWSGQDESNMENIMKYKKFFVFIVGSNKNYKVRVAIRDPVKHNFDDVLLRIKTVQIEIMRNLVKYIFGQNNVSGEKQESDSRPYEVEDE